MSERPRYQIEPLDVTKHRRTEFSCESPELTDYLQRRARKEMEARTSACFVLVLNEDPGRIVGFYTLSTAEIELAKLPDAISKKLPRYPYVPVTLLGRLARDERFRAKGIGGLLMMDAMSRTLAGSANIGSIGLITDPKDEQAATFYEEFGFQPLVGKRLFLGMREIATLLEQT